MIEILAYIESVDKAIRSVINFTKFKIIDDQIDEISEVVNSMKKFTNECISCWDNYRKIIYTYFPKKIKRNQLEKLEGILTVIDYLTKGLNTIIFTGIMPDVLRNQQELLKNQSKDFLEVKEINLKIRKKYLALLIK